MLEPKDQGFLEATQQTPFKDAGTPYGLAGPEPKTAKSPSLLDPQLAIESVARQGSPQNPGIGTERHVFESGENATQSGRDPIIGNPPTAAPEAHLSAEKDPVTGLPALPGADPPGEELDSRSETSTNAVPSTGLLDQGAGNLSTGSGRPEGEESGTDLQPGISGNADGENRTTTALANQDDALPVEAGGVAPSLQRTSSQGSPLDGPLGGSIEESENQGVFQVDSKVSEDISLRFAWAFRDAGFDNEVGIVEVDSEGNVGGVPPTDPGYTRAVLNDPSQRTIFGSGSGTGSWNEQTLPSGTSFATYLIQNGSRQQWLDADLNGASAGEQPTVFFSLPAANGDGFDHFRTNSIGGSVVELQAEDITGGGDQDFNDVVFQISAEGLLAPGLMGQEAGLQVNYTGGEAGYKSELGMYYADDAYGRIGNLLPADPGYAQAALSQSRSQVIFSRDEMQGAIREATVASGKFIAWYLIADASSDTWRASNPDNDLDEGPIAWFSHPGANPDGLNHILYRTNNELAWEDLPGGGDTDYNDLVFSYTLTPPPQNLPPSLRIDEQLASISEAADTSERVKVATLTVLDDSLGTNSLALTGTDASSFELVGRELFLKAGVALDTESKPEFSVAVEVDDETVGLSPDDRVEIVLIVDNVNESPRIDNQAFSVDENSVEGTVVGRISASDPDRGDQLSFRIKEGNEDGIFALNSSSGELSVANPLALDFESLPSIPLTVEVSDGELSDGATVTVNLNDLPEGILLREEEFFQVVSQEAITIPEGPSVLRFTYEDLSFDPTDTDAINDALEAALVDAEGNSLVHTIAGSRDAFFNITEGEAALLAPGASQDGTTVTLNLAGLPAGTPATLLIRLVNNDSDESSQVRVTDISVESADVTAPGGVTPVPTALRAQALASIDFATLSDLTSSFRTEYGRTSFNDDSRTLFTEVAINNAGSYAVADPLLVAIALQDPEVRVVDPDGFTAEGLPFYDFSALAATPILQPGEATSIRTFQFYNPSGNQFNYELSVLGQLNRNPAFTSDPRVDVVTGQQYQYQAEAKDADDDTLTYSLTMAPEGMAIDPQTGALSWSTEGVAPGAASVEVLVDDGRGGIDRQSFAVAVRGDIPNRPPSFVSVPVIQGNVGSSYSYAIEALDPDGDALTYEISEGPEGLILGDEGKLSWEPTATQLGQNPVTVVARDGRGGEARQTFQIQVLADPGNLAPRITTTPITSINLDTTPGELTSIDLSTWTQVNYDSTYNPAGIFTHRFPANWILEGADNTIARQTNNADPSILLGDFDASGVAITGTWRVDDPPPTDDDLMGFVFGYQDPENFYLFDWKQAPQNNFGGSALRGMSIKRVTADSPLSSYDLWHTAGNGDRVESLFHNRLMWKTETDYEFELEFVPGQFTIAISEGDTLLESVTIEDDTFVDGKFGFYNNSQNDVLYSGFRRQTIPLSNYAYDVDAIDPDADPLSFSLIEGPRGMAIDPTSGALSWFATEDNLGQQAVTVAVEDGRGGIDTQSYLLEVNNIPPGEIRGQVRGERSFDPAGPIRVTVPGTSDPWLAGMPDGSTASSGDVAPDQSPVFVEDLDLDGVAMLLFAASGAVNNGPSLPRPNATSDGGSLTPHFSRAQNGIGDVTAPVNGLIGLFLTDEQPDATPAPTESLNFNPSTGNVDNGINYDSITPLLKQPFFIGDGFAEDGGRQEVVVPTGATRLFLGSMDGFGWFNNSGEIDVEIAAVIPGQNLIANGDFSLGDFGFEADRADIPVFDVGTDPQDFNGLASSYGDHTSGDGNMLIVNGSFTQPTVVWEQTIPVQENVLYDFSLWSSTWFPASPANFQVLVNGEVIDSFQAPETTAVWENFTTQWNADPGIVEATISIVNQQIAFTGNDFAFDDLFFGATAGSEALDGITVFIDSNNNTVVDSNEQAQQTDETGRYRFGGLAPGDYLVRQLPPRGFEQIQPGDAEPNQVNLEAGEVETGVDFIIQPIEIADNSDPVLLSEVPSSSIEIGERFTAQILAKDGNGDPLTYDLPLAPEGMVIDAETGVIAWVPNAEQTGDNVVITRVRDDFGGVVLQRFSLDVLLPNTDPVIVSSPPQLAAVGVPLVYGVLAQDSEEDELTYSLLNAPDGATISPLGQLEWTPLAGQEGLQSFSIEVGDGRGGSATQAFEVETRSTLPNQAPQITSSPRTELRVGDRYLYQVEANDPDFETLSYALSTAPTGMTISERGLVEWDSDGSALGAYPVALVVTDSRGEVAEQALNLQVLSTATNRAPVFTSTPPVIAIAGQPFRYQPEVSDADGDPVAFFPSGLFSQPLPARASNNPATGEIRWTPGFEDLGRASFAVTASDPYGGVATQVFEVEVVAGNRPPLISSTPITEAAVGDAYAYAIEAEDPDGGPLTFSLSRGPRNMVLDSSILRWSPIASQRGEQQVTVEAIDALGAATAQSFTVLVTENLPNRAPVITSMPGFTAEPDKPYRYQVQATDPEGGALTFVLEEAPDGVSLDPTTGLLEWTPTPAQIGLANISLKAQDPQGLGLIQTYSLAVAVNNPPEISSTPPLQVTAGADYSYDLLASDPDGGQLGYQLLEAPDGMTIDNFGRLRWPTSSAVIGRAPVRVVVADNGGATAEQAFELEVVADTQAPSISILQNNTVVERGETVTFQVRATDDVGVDSISLSVGGRAIGLDANGQANVVLDGLGPVVATATATDAAGNTGSAEATAQAIDSSDVDAPVVSITSINDGDVITSPIDVIGSVTDDNLISYSLSVARAGGGPFREIATGSDVVMDGAVGRFDPTLLENDSYILRLSATDAGGNVSTTERQVNLDGQLKLGNFQLSFVDLSIPVAGIPITVSRTYDTLQADTSDDLGFGWSLGLFDTNLRTDVPPSGLEASDIYNPFQIGSKVYITNPSSGRREGFTFTAQSPSRFAIFGNVRPRFIPDPGVTSTLSVQPIDLAVTDTGEVVSFVGSLPYNPASGLFGGFYTLTSKEGIRYRVNGNTGDVESITDRNGNVLSFDEAGISSSTGEAITFERDPQGRITAVIDPAGNRITYSYDNNGDLIAVTDREGNSTTHEYNGQFEHHLDKIIDSKGDNVIGNFYSEDGRVNRVVSGFGESVEISYDTEGLIVDALTPAGNQVIFQLDERGNVISEIDALNNLTERVYDAEDKLLSETNPLGDSVHYTYDAQGNMLSFTDSLSNADYYSYNSNSQLVNATDSLGQTEEYEYDTFGNLVSVTDPLRRITTQTYDEMGNTTSTTDASGNRTTFNYRRNGSLSTVVDALGTATFLDHDPLLNVTSISREILTPAGSEVVTLSGEYDNNGNLTSFTDAQGNTSLYEYDELGNLDRQTDPLGNSIITSFEGNRPVLQRYSDGTQTEISYQQGTLLDGYVNRADSLASSIAYDLAQQPTGVSQVDLATNKEIQRSLMLDPLGRPTGIIDENGNTQRIVYDSNGNIIEHVDGLGHSWTATYDNAGRVKTRTDPLGNSYSFKYDEAGQLIEYTYPDGSSNTFEYDLLGLMTSFTNPEGDRTQYEYDPRGLLTAVISPQGNRTEYIYNVLGHLTGITDAAGRETRFEYDPQGRQTAIIRPLGERAEFSYDANGNMIEKIDFNGNRSQFTYDSNSLLTSEAHSNGLTREYSYTPSGLIRQVRDERGTTEYAYDGFYRLISKKEPDGRVINLGYDDFGNLISMESPNQSVGYSYDAANRLISVEDSDLGATRYQYDSTGNLKQILYPNDLTEVREYDTQNRVSTITTLDSLGNTLQSFRYERDGAGTIVSVAETAPSQTVTYSFDRLNRLSSQSVTSSEGTTQSVHTTEYEYDSVGNLLRKIDSIAGVSTYQYNENDQLIQIQKANGDVVSYSYDPNGNRLQESVNGVKTSIYSWNEDNQLRSVDVDADDIDDIFYSYDHTGLRVAKQHGSDINNYLFDITQDHPSPIEVTTSNGELVSRYIRGHSLIASDSPGIDVNYYHLDDHSGVRFLTNKDGSVTDKYVYDAYGSLLDIVGETPNNYFYRGEFLDSDIEEYYLRARNYDPEIGRFTSTDPFEGILEQPMSLHRYLYANNNPIKFQDPSGKVSILAGILAGISLIPVLGPLVGAVGSAALGITRTNWDRGSIRTSQIGDFAPLIVPGLALGGVGAIIGLINVGGGKITASKADYEGEWILGFVGLGLGLSPYEQSESSFDKLSSWKFIGNESAFSGSFILVDGGVNHTLTRKTGKYWDEAFGFSGASYGYYLSSFGYAGGYGVTGNSGLSATLIEIEFGLSFNTKDKPISTAG